MGYLISTAMELVRDLLEPDVRWTAFAIFVAGLLLGRLSKRRQPRKIGRHDARVGRTLAVKGTGRRAL